MALTDPQLAWLASDNVRIVLVEAAYGLTPLGLYCNNDNGDVPPYPYIYCNRHTAVPTIYCNATGWEENKECIYLANTPYITDSTPFEDIAGNDVAHISYDDALDSIPSISARIDSSATLGSINVVNALGDYDFMFVAEDDTPNSIYKVGFEGQKIKVLIGDGSWPRAQFIPAFEGIIDSVLAPDKNKVSISIRDNKDIFDKSHNVHTITPGMVSEVAQAATQFTLKINDFPRTGDPSGTTLLDYEPAKYILPPDVENTRVPICLGSCFNVEPVLIDAWNHIYMIHHGDGGITSVSAVKSNGILLDGPLDVSPQYEVDEAIGCIRLLDHPQSSRITVDCIGAVERGTGYDTDLGNVLITNSVAWLIEWLVLELTDLESTDIDYPSFLALDLANSSTVGIFFKGEESVATLLTAVANSIGSFYRFDRANKLQLTILEDPSTLPVPDTIIGPDSIIRNGISIQSMEPPKNQLTLSYLKNWTVMAKEEQAGILSEEKGLETQQQLASEYKTLIKHNGSIKIQFPLAETQDTIETLLVDFLDAQDEIDRRAVIREIKRYTYKLNSVVAPLDLSVGDTVVVQSDRFGLDAGETAVILSMSEKLTSNRVDLEVWK